MKKIATAMMAAAAMVAGSSSAPVFAGFDPFIGELNITGSNFCPRGSARADGQLLAISSNSALFSLVGTIYGGDGRTTFGLPDLRGRAPLHTGNGPGLSSRPMGQRGGAETNTLSLNQMPSHTHTGNILAAHTAPADTKNPKGNAFARSGTLNYENTEAPSTNLADAMHSGTVVIANAGGNQQVNNMSPYEVVNYCIELFGVYPSRS